jgi:chorismate-pyruvate lyase
VPRFFPTNPRLSRRAALIGFALGAALCGLAQADPVSWPDSYGARVAALALLQTLNADLLSHDSATSTLQHWCESHKLAPDPRIIATRMHVDPKPPSGEQRQALHVAADDEVRYRHVQLSCGSLVLSEADNWYVPGRLTAQMNHLLETTETPFGAIVRELHFQRHTLSARLLWSPLPEDWEMHRPPEPGSGALTVPPEVLEHRAILSLPDGTPFSEVVETYTGNVLAFPPPQTEPGAPHAPR